MIRSFKISSKSLDGELVFNFLLGASFIYWSFAGIQSYEQLVDIPPVRIAVSSLNLLIGGLIIFRRRIREAAKFNFLLVALPSLFCGGILFKLAKPFELWEFHLNALFIVGCLLTSWSFLFLGRNFSILPYTRNIVCNGPFRFVRHPAYFGESIMMLSCLIASEKPWLAGFIFLLFLPSLIGRILAEEQLLSKQLVYQKYKKQVRWRLIPKVW
ncbi:MAG: methyltransferase [Bacteroidota bacterium]